MKKTIYYMHKPGDTRDYAMTTVPSPEWSKSMAAQGFKLFECLVDIPTEAVVLEGYGDEAAPAEEVPLLRGPDCPVWKCSDCGAGLGQEHQPNCAGVQRARDKRERTGGSSVE